MGEQDTTAPPDPHFTPRLLASIGSLAMAACTERHTVGVDEREVWPLTALANVMHLVGGRGDADQVAVVAERMLGEERLAEFPPKVGCTEVRLPDLVVLGSHTVRCDTWQARRSRGEAWDAIGHHLPLGFLTEEAATWLPPVLAVGVGAVDFTAVFVAMVLTTSIAAWVRRYETARSRESPGSAPSAPGSRRRSGAGRAGRGAVLAVCRHSERTEESAAGGVASGLLAFRRGDRSQALLAQLLEEIVPPLGLDHVSHG